MSRDGCCLPALTFHDEIPGDRPGEPSEEQPSSLEGELDQDGFSSETLLSGSFEEGLLSAVLHADFLGVSGLWNLMLEGAATRFLWRAYPDPDSMTLPPITEKV